ncbi:MAG: hypothetical protein RRA15_05835 [bacterium]|nr:hypothetical protein [bacterium]MDT8365996.1 hypothetical protein [bacterium]
MEKSKITLLSVLKKFETLIISILMMLMITILLFPPSTWAISSARISFHRPCS